MSSVENKRPSAMKIPAVLREPLLGSPVQAAPLKAARTGEATAMTEDLLPEVPGFPTGSSGSLAPRKFSHESIGHWYGRCPRFPD